MSSTRLELLASAAQTATGQGGGISVAGIRELALCVDITSVSGSLSCIYLQTSSDGGTTWYDILTEAFVHLTTGTGGGTTGSWARNVGPVNMTTGQIAKAYARFAMFGDYIRAAWTISGSGPSCTFSVKAIGKS